MFLEVQIITILLTIIHLHPIPILQTTIQVTEHQPTTIVIKAVAAVRLLENFKFNFFLGTGWSRCCSSLAVYTQFGEDTGIYITMFIIVQSLQFLLF